MREDLRRKLNPSSFEFEKHAFGVFYMTLEMVDIITRTSTATNSLASTQHSIPYGALGFLSRVIPY